MRKGAIYSFKHEPFLTDRANTMPSKIRSLQEGHISPTVMMVDHIVIRGKTVCWTPLARKDKQAPQEEDGEQEL